MIRRRTIALAGLVLALAAPSAAVAANSAGDDQYADPFGDTTTATTPSSSAKADGLTQTVQLKPASTTATTTTAASTPTTTTTAPAASGVGTSTTATGELPDTGTDPRLLALAGIGLLLAGIGLRLRTADDRF